MKKLPLLAMLALPAWASAYSAILTTEHVDIGVAYENDAWDLHVHDEDNDAEYESDDALLYVGASAKTARFAGSQWDFTGAAAGEDLWILPQTQDFNLLFLGIGAEEIDPGTFSGNVRLALDSFDGTGHFSAWTFDGGGNVVPIFSTFDGAVINFFEVPQGGHGHVNWGFTATGIQKVSFVGSGVVPGGGRIFSDAAEYHFGVEAVPEPATMIALGAGLAAFAARRHRKN